MEIKAIETEYNGYRFRSRLEARWAVFFDTANIQYEYEPEGYVLRDRTRYLPDFFLPKFDLFIEIKPFDTSIVSSVGDGNRWERKCRMFRDTTGKAILICYGCPADDIPKYLFAFDTCDSGGGTYEGQAYFMGYGRQHPHIVLCTEPERKDRTIYTREWITNENVGTPLFYAGNRKGAEELVLELACRPYSSLSDSLIDRAKTASRQARFEYGECGIKKNSQISKSANKPKIRKRVQKKIVKTPEQREREFEEYLKSFISDSIPDYKKRNYENITWVRFEILANLIFSNSEEVQEKIWSKEILEKVNEARANGASFQCVISFLLCQESIPNVTKNLFISAAKHVEIGADFGTPILSFGGRDLRDFYDNEDIQRACYVLDRLNWLIIPTFALSTKIIKGDK